MDKKQKIAQRIARELKDGDVVNLGIGIPTLVANYLPKDIRVLLQSENGMINMGPVPELERVDPDIANAGGQPVSILPGGSFFDSTTSFTIIRGGHVDLTVLGALEVDEKGNLANWMVPGKLVPGMGGAMDLVVGAKRVVVATEHTTKDGRPKILKVCTLPLTAVREVDLIVTELAVIEVTEEGLVLKELASDTTLEEVQRVTEPKLIIGL
jgi:acetate CoA/acetoacetate CoA-transferase beta subunit